MSEIDHDGVLRAIPEMEDFQLISTLHTLAMELEARIMSRAGEPVTITEEDVGALPF